jgi:hypothetical protein
MVRGCGIDDEELARAREQPLQKESGRRVALDATLEMETGDDDPSGTERPLRQR